MRLAFVSTMYAFAWGGSEELWARCAEAALADGHEVHLFLYRWPERPARVAALEQAGAIVHLRGRHDSSLPRLALLHAAMRSAAVPIPVLASAFHAVATVKPDLVCVSQGDLYSSVRENVALVRWLRATRTPYAVICQFADDNEMVRPFARERAGPFLGEACAVFFVAEANRRTAERQLARRLPRAMVVRNPVNLRDRSIVPWPESSRAEFACVAKLAVYAKGQDALLEALARSHWLDRDWRLNLFGVGADEPYLRTLADLYGLTDRVVFRGFAHDIRSLWAEHQVLVLPSRAEGTPLALVEAMLCGRPAVVSGVAGNPEWVTDGATGWIAAAVSASALDVALDRAWQARGDWAAMGAKAHEVAAERVPLDPGRELLECLLEAYERADDRAVREETRTISTEPTRKTSSAATTDQATASGP